MLPDDGTSATCRPPLSGGIGLASTSASCLPLPCLYSAPTLRAISAGPPWSDVSDGCHLDQFFARPASSAGSFVLCQITIPATSAAATTTPASAPTKNPKRLRNADGPGVGRWAGCAPERGGSGGSSIRFGTPPGVSALPAGEGG